MCNVVAKWSHGLVQLFERPQEVQGDESNSVVLPEDLGWAAPGGDYDL